jgi:hypothetical protein
MRRLRIGMARVNTTISDLVANRQKILKTIGEAMSLGIDFSTLPELAICSCRPEALLFKPHFIAKNLDESFSAELRPDQRDTDALPPYELPNLLPTAYVEADRGVEQIIVTAIHEREVKVTARLVDTSEYKHRQAPAGVRIALKAFGWDRGCLLPINTMGHKA